MNFQFFSPARIVAGRGKISEIGAIASEFGKRVFLITGRSFQKNPAFSLILDQFNKIGIESVLYEKPDGEPDVLMTDSAAKAASDERCDLVISIGGGAVIDLGKAVAGLVTNGGSVLEYMEGIGTGKQVTKQPLPHIAVPTTAGTGAEVTRNAVITAKEVKYKKSFRSPYLFPTVAVLDAELTLHLPPEQTAYSGMDAITQLIESFITKKASPMTDALALSGLELAFSSMREAYFNGTNIDAREKLLLASTLSGICLANAGLGMAHGFAPAFGALYDIPHGKTCAILLPHAMRFNCATVPQKMAAIGRLLPGPSSASDSVMANKAVLEVEKLVKDLGIPSDFSAYQIPKTEIDAICERSKGNSLDGNPVLVSQEKAKEFLETLL